MPDPTTKAEMLRFMAAGRSVLEAALGRLTEAELHAPTLPGEWSVKDAMAHIAHWELRVVERLQTCARGETPVRRTVSVDAMNQAVYEENLGKPLTEVRQAFEDAHLTLLQEVERLSEADLFDACPSRGRDGRRPDAGVGPHRSGELPALRRAPSGVGGCVPGLVVRHGARPAGAARFFVE